MVFKKDLNLGVVLTALITVALFIIVYLLHTSPYVNLSIVTATPMLFLPLICSISCFSSLWGSVAAGLVAGALLDSVSSGFYSFNIIIFLVISVLAWLLSNNFFNKNLGAAFTLTLIAAVFYKIVWWLVNYSLVLDIRESFALLLQYALPSALYSAVFIVPLFYTYKWLNKIKAN